MGILDFFLNRDPSRTWPAHQRVDLDLRYESGILNSNIRLGNPVSDLAQLGKPDNKNPHKTQWFSYYASGLEVEGEGGKIVGYHFIFRDDYRKFFQEASLYLGSANLSRTRLSARTQVDDILKLLGEPKSREDYDDELILLYGSSRWSLEFQFIKNQGLGEVTLYLEGDQ